MTTGLAIQHSSTVKDEESRKQARFLRRNRRNDHPHHTASVAAQAVIRLT